MKQLLKEDLLILSRLFTVKNTALVVLGNDTYKDQPGIIHSQDQLKKLLEENPQKQYSIFNLLGVSLSDYYSHHNVRLILNFGTTNNQEQSFSLINNPDGTIRWIFPSNAAKPYFLNLYNSSGLRSKLIRQVFKIGWKLRLSKLLCSANFTLFNKDKYPLKSILKSNDEHWSLFTGTVGPNRKIIVELNNGKQTQHFIKIPVTLTSENLVENEFLQLKDLQGLNLQLTAIPKVVKQGKAIQLTNIKPQTPLDNIQLKTQHLRAIQEWYTKSYNPNQSTEKLFTDIKDNLNFLKSYQYSGEQGIQQEQVKRMQAALDKLFYTLKAKTNWKTGWCHGDFTPWNMFLSKNKIHVYDWEMANQEMPLLYDLFHFVFQSGVLLKRSGFHAIEWELEQLNKHPIIKEIKDQFSIDFEAYKLFYLVHNVSKYMTLYCKQERLQKQVNWLIQCWSKALEKELMKLELKEFTTRRKPVDYKGELTARA